MHRARRRPRALRLRSHRALPQQQAVEVHNLERRRRCASAHKLWAEPGGPGRGGMAGLVIDP